MKRELINMVAAYAAFLLVLWLGYVFVDRAMVQYHVSQIKLKGK